MKQNQFLYLSTLIILVVFQQCAPTKTISTKGAESYNEDLSQYRIQYADSIAQGNSPQPNAEPLIVTASALPTPNAVTDEIFQYFEEIDDLNREKNKYQGYTLQVYAGGSREQANKAKLKVYEVLPDADPVMSFGTIFRTRVGQYANRLESQQDYFALRKVFPNVLLVPQTFDAVE